MNKIEILNKLLKLTYEYGYRVGYSWHDYNELVDIDGHLKNEDKIETEIKQCIEELAPLLELSEKELIVYFIEDKSVHEGDWDYIPPTIERKIEDE